MKTPILSVLATILLLTACGGSSPSQPLVSPAVKVNQPPRTDGVTFKVDRAVNLQDDLLNVESFQSNLNIYTVTITIPNTIAQDLRIKKLHENSYTYQILDGAAYQYGKDNVTVTDVIDLNEVTLNAQNYEYEIQNEDKSLQPISFSIKPDLVIVGSRNLSDLKLTSLDIEVGTLFLDANASLITQGNSLSIKAETIISKDASIETFTEAAAAVASGRGQPGISGGDLKVTTNLLIGNVNIYMRGKKGGQGIDGLVVTEVPPTAASGNPSSESTTCDWFGLLVSEGTAFREPREHCDRKCAAYPTSGQPGAKGYQGKNGNPGAQGGASGRIEFTAVKANQSKVNVKLIPGAGGEPGAGSAGGAGGAGGAPGAVRHPLCNGSSATTGPQGPQGDAGVAGAPGAPGLEQKPTIILNGKTE